VALSIVVDGLALAISFLMNSNDTIALVTLEDDSVEIVEIRRTGAKVSEVINRTVIWGTPDVQESSKTSFIIKLESLIQISHRNHHQLIFCRQR